MDARTRTHLGRQLTARRDTIAERWYSELAADGLGPHVPAAVRRLLADLTARAGALLLAEPFPAHEARALGSALADLHALSAAALGRTLAVLGQELPAGLPPAQAVALQPRLAALLGELAAGFHAQARAALLTEQEEVRHTLAEARQQAEVALRRSEERLRAVVTNTPVMLFALDRAGVFTLAEGRGLAALGLTPAAVVGRSAFELFAGAPRLLDDVRGALAGEDRTVVAAVAGVVFEARHTPLRDERGAVVGAIGVATDITKRARAEERLHTVAANAPIVLFALDRAGVITLSEGQGLAALGRRGGETVGRSVFELYGDMPQILADVRRALAGEVFTDVVTVAGATFEARYAPLRAPDGTPAGVIGVATDITERMRCEVALQRFEAGLSPQERRVLPLLAREDRPSYRQIGAELHIEGETVRDHIQGIARKLDVPARREDVVTAARERGLLDPPHLAPSAPEPPPATPDG